MVAGEDLVRGGEDDRGLGVGPVGDPVLGQINEITAKHHIY